MSPLQPGARTRFTYAWVVRWVGQAARWPGWVVRASETRPEAQLLWAGKGISECATELGQEVVRNAERQLAGRMAFFQVSAKEKGPECPGRESAARPGL